MGSGVGESYQSATDTGGGAERKGTQAMLSKSEKKIKLFINSLQFQMLCISYNLLIFPS